MIVSGGVGVVAETDPDNADTLPAVSRARTWYVCVEPPSTVASVYVRTAPTLASEAPSRQMS